LSIDRDLQKAAEDAARQSEGAAKIRALLHKDKPKDKETPIVPAVEPTPAPPVEKVEIQTVVPTLEVPKVLGKMDLSKKDFATPKREDWIEHDRQNIDRNRSKKDKEKDRQKRRNEPTTASKQQPSKKENDRPKDNRDRSNQRSNGQNQSQNQDRSKKQEPRSAAREAIAAAEKAIKMDKTAIKAAAKEKLDAIFGKKDKPVAQDETFVPQRESSFIPTQYESLAGLKVVDKIDVSRIRYSKPERSSEQGGSGGSTSRGKRKRITTAAVNVGNKYNKGGGKYDKKRTNKNNNSTNKNNRNNDRNDKFKKKRPIVSEAEVEKKMKETLAKMMEKGNKTKTSKYRRDKRDAVSEKIQAERRKQDVEIKTLELTEFVTANDLSKMMDTPINAVIDACMNLGLMVSLNQRLDAEAIALIVENFGYKASFVSPDTQSIEDDIVDAPEDLLPRAPIVTVMGHVDHGKTSLIDNIRKTNIIAGEAGGITQHIGAYHVDLPDDRQITFLDTPGHEAFTAMRARGAQATDVAIIIIAATDSVMPQTTEAINHAVAANVPIIFAINKIDMPGAAPDKIREQLASMNFLVEDWGGKYQVQEIAAKSGVNVDKLLVKILVETDLLELKANPNRHAKGVVIESLLDKGRGYISRMLVQNGTLHLGDVILSGQHVGRVKAMFNERGKKVKEAGPSIPVEILGLNGATTAGDAFIVMEDEREARSIASQREQLQRIQGLRTQKHITLDEIGRRIAIGNFKELNIIVKADVDGSKEALTDSLLKLSTEQVQLNVIHSGVGAISESDVQLAIATESIIICFQVRPSATVRKMAEQEGIDIRSYSIIYDAINEIKDAILGMHAPVYKEKIVCTVEILQVYHISKIGNIAGCIVREGKITRQTKVRVIRDGIVIHTGKIDALKRFKDDVKEVTMGFECGLNLTGFNDIEVSDVVEGYDMEEVVG
jgi:translation initiation factor IF-2